MSNEADGSVFREIKDVQTTPSISLPSSALQSPNLTVTDISSDLPDSPPPYGEQLGEISNDDVNVGAKATVCPDGRVNVRIDQHTKGLQSLLVPALRSTLNLTEVPPLASHVPTTYSGAEHRPPPPLNVVIHVVGSRGDVQPFVALGKVLKDRFKHRVRLATHANFKDFVEENGLEFFNISGDPSELMAFMVKNPGLMPGFESLRRGDVGRRRKEIRSMLQGCWRSCIEPGDGMSNEMALGDSTEASGVRFPEYSANDLPRPFIADAIIANPPSFAHVHCAEKLGIPLHMMFTMPWTPTQSFPHPLANIQSSNADTNITNFMSYALVDMMTWQGLGDIINRFRQKTLGLEPLNLTWAPGMLARLKLSFTYCWSPTLIPKPRDWGQHITISGFYFLPLGGSYVPAPELQAFLDAGPPPVYIGFGSIVLDDPNGMTNLIFEAVKLSGQRALISKGWGGFGAEEIAIPDNIFMLGNVPHDWLFRHVSCVVHHGGAGTTAAGIAAGKPTVVVPFFGDQPFWGAMIARAGAGPQPIHNKQLTAEKLAAAIREALLPETLAKAGDMRYKIATEKGTEAGADFFHRDLDVDKIRCHLAPHRAAVWRIRRTNVRLSAFAATILAEEKLLKFSDLKLYRAREINTEDDPWDPITGGASALLGTMGSMAMGVADLPVSALKALRIHPEVKGADSPGRSRSATINNQASAPSGMSPVKDREQKDSLSTDATSAPEMQASTERSRDELSRDFDANSSRATLMPTPTASPKPRPAAQESSAVPKSADRSSEPLNESREASRARSMSGISSFAPTRSRSGSRWDIESALETGKGGVKVVSAGIKSPMDFTLAIAKGFHNAPKLYGDETVRRPEKVTDFASGLRAAGRELAFGLGDGISGLVTQPLAGAKKEGAAGLVKGFGKGVGGLIFKPGAAIWGIPGYTSKGIYMELQKAFGPSIDNYLIATRSAQGFDEVQRSSARERAMVIEGWKEVRRLIHKKKSRGEEQLSLLQKHMQEHMDRLRSLSLSGNVRPDISEELWRTTTMSTVDSGVYSPEESEMIVNPLSREHSFHQVRHIEPMEPELEQAIRQSIVETSRGSDREDADIEAAIRASVHDIQELRQAGAEEAEVDRAMEASIAHARQGLRPKSVAVAEIEGDADYDRAVEESLKSHADDEDDRRRAQEREDIVMQYIRDQSAAEEELRRRRADC